MTAKRKLRSIWANVKPVPPKLTLTVAVLGAIVGAAGTTFTIFRFYYYDRAAYEPRAAVNSTLEWKSSNLTNQCEATFRVDIENVGAAPFDIDEIRVRAYSFDSSLLGDQKAVYLSLDQMEKGPRLFDSADPLFKPHFEKETTPFAGHYAVGGKFFRTFQWLIARDAGRNVYFRIDLKVKDKNLNWFTAAWSPNCGESQTPSATPSPSPTSTR
ncbi:MAG TPA: hypothetical protein VHP99_12790 [Pyrinomonadaceae bacterium]|nr:hypothetical protein [Pyrinomonadaceae bacterium]